jgi:hypothetical protein
VVAATQVPFVPTQTWDPAIYADPIHLSETGALRLTAELANRLKPEIGAASRG